MDLACDEAHNSIFLALKGVEVISCDLSSEALKRAGELATEWGAEITVWQVDLEPEGDNPLPERTYGAILVFRYLHRPLIPCIKKALRNGGLLLYETFTKLGTKSRESGVRIQNPGGKNIKGLLSGYWLLTTGFYL